MIMTKYKNILEEFTNTDISVGETIHYIYNTGKGFRIYTGVIRRIYFDYTTIDISTLTLYKCMDFIRRGNSFCKNTIQDIAIEAGKKWGYENVLEELPNLRLGSRFLWRSVSGKHYGLYGDGKFNSDIIFCISKIPHILAIPNVSHIHYLLLKRFNKFLNKYKYFTYERNNDGEEGFF